MFLAVAWVIAYRYRSAFTSIEWQRINWLVFGLILIALPGWSSLLLSLGLPEQIIYSFNIDTVLSMMGRGFAYSIYLTLIIYFGTIPVLIVAGIMAYRYHCTFTTIERQQMKWPIFGLILGVGPAIVLYMFAAYYYITHQSFTATGIRFSSFIDKLLILELAIIAFCLESCVIICTTWISLSTALWSMAA